MLFLLLFIVNALLSLLTLMQPIYNHTEWNDCLLSHLSPTKPHLKLMNIQAKHINRFAYLVQTCPVRSLFTVFTLHCLFLQVENWC